LRLWYGVLERKVKLKTAATTAIGKMVVDQFAFAPVFLFSFIGLMGAINGDSVGQIKSDIRNNYFDIMLTNYKV